MRRTVITLTLLIFGLPAAAHAAVTINEVAWMGDTTSANNEWIELYNSGGNTSVDGWTLTDGMNLSIPLSGTISAGAYAVLERTDDNSAPGKAFLIYTGALTNSGATLTLYRADGSIEDQVAGGENWQNVGGDNTTKETAQYTPQGWTTAPPTPGAPNAPYSPPSVATSNTTDTTSPAPSSGPPVAKPVAPNVTTPPDYGAPHLDLSVPETAYVHEPVVLSAKAGGYGNTILASMVYQWNFGDLATGTGVSPTHTFNYPGDYVVTVHASYEGMTVTNHAAVTVLPVPLTITENQTGDIQIHNTAKYDVDLSGYVVVAGKRVMVPNDTWLLANATITVPHTQLGYTGNGVSVFDAAGMRVASYETSSPHQAAPASPVPRVSPTVAYPVAAPVAPTPGPTPDPAPKSATTTTPLSISVPTTPPNPLVAAAGATTRPSSWYAFVGLLGIIAVGLLALVVRSGGGTEPMDNLDDDVVVISSRRNTFFDEI